MSWLNWLLKLHIRLRTISSLVPTHITHVYIHWMPYSFVWLYLFKCVALTQSYVDQTQKDFWVFKLFLESILIWKFSKFSKTVQLCFGDSLLWVKLVASLLRSSCNSLASQAPNREKDLEKFQYFWVFSIFVTQFGGWFVCGTSSCEFTQNASRLTREWTF